MELWAGIWTVNTRCQRSVSNQETTTAPTSHTRNRPHHRAQQAHALQLGLVYLSFTCFRAFLWGHFCPLLERGDGQSRKSCKRTLLSTGCYETSVSCSKAFLMPGLPPTSQSWPEANTVRCKKLLHYFNTHFTSDLIHVKIKFTWLITIKLGTIHINL